MKNKDGINYILINITIFVFLIFLLNKLNIIKPLLNILSLIFFSLIFSYIVYPIYKLLSNKMNKVLAIFIIYIFIFLFLILIIYKSIINVNFIQNIIDLFENIFIFINKINLKYNLNIDLSYIKETLINFILNNSVNIIKNIINYLSKFIFIIILSICILLNIEYIKMIVNKLKYKKLIYNINKRLKTYLISNIKILIIQLIEYTFIFYIIGHPNYLLLGIFNSLNNFIPYIGSFITNILAITTSSVISNKLLFLTSIVSIILPNIDAYIITPKIHKEENKLPEVLCITSVIICSIMFKFYGLILGVPILIVIIEILKYKNIVKNN